MNLKKLKFTALAAALAVTSVVFPSCAKPDGKTVISVGMWGGGSSADREYYLEVKRGFEKMYPQYELVSSPYEYSEDTVTAKFASGQLPAVFEADAMFAKSALKNGYFLDVAPYLARYGWLSAADGNILSEISVDGAVGGVPYEQYAAGMVLNLPLLYEAGVISRSQGGEYILYDVHGSPLYPDTFAKLTSAFEKVAQGSGAYGLFLPSGDARCGKIYADLSYNYGGGYLEVKGEDGWSLDLSGQAFGEALRWVKNSVQDGYIDASLPYGYDEWAVKMSGGEVAVAFCESNLLASALAAYPSLKGNVAFVPLPSADGVQSRAVQGCKIFAVNGGASADVAEGVFRLLAYLGYGADAGEVAFASSEKRLSALYARDIPVFPSPAVWLEGEYSAKREQLYANYKNYDERYFGEFFIKFDDFKRKGEPYYRNALNGVLDKLYADMIFNPNETDVVALLQAQEREFTENRLSRIED